MNVKRLCVWVVGWLFFLSFLYATYTHTLSKGVEKNREKRYNSESKKRRKTATGGKCFAFCIVRGKLGAKFKQEEDTFTEKTFKNGYITLAWLSKA